MTLQKLETQANEPYRFCYDVSNRTFQVHARPANMPVLNLKDAPQKLIDAGKVFVKELSAYHELQTDDDKIDVATAVDALFVEKAEPIKTPIEEFVEKE